MFLLYSAIFWANATAVPLFARYIFGDVFRFSYLYTIFGYEIYLGELLLTAAVIGITVLLMTISKKATARAMIGLSAVFIIGITVCFIVGVVNYLSGSVGFEPGFAPDGLPLVQIARIASISPWAFIGFESVTHSSAEFKFSKKSTFTAINDFNSYHNGTASAEILEMSESEYLSVLNERLNTTNTVSLATVIGLFVVSIGGFLSNYFSMKKYENKLESDVEQKSQHIIQLQQSFVVGILTMIESRDNSTGGHIKRTSDVMQILLDEMKKDESLGIDDDSYTYMITAAPMHDIGKIAIDDAILRKPGKLTPEEYETMKSHTKEGARILWELVDNEDNAQFRQIAVNMALYHHERIDGTGYPQKLKGDEIPLEARILAIADVYDALASKRAYKEQMSGEEVYNIILFSDNPLLLKGLCTQIRTDDAFPRQPEQYREP